MIFLFSSSLVNFVNRFRWSNFSDWTSVSKLHNWTLDAIRSVKRTALLLTPSKEERRFRRIFLEDILWFWPSTVRVYDDFETLEVSVTLEMLPKSSKNPWSVIKAFRNEKRSFDSWEYEQLSGWIHGILGAQSSDSEVQSFLSASNFAFPKSEFLSQKFAVSRSSSGISKWTLISFRKVLFALQRRASEKKLKWNLTFFPPDCNFGRENCVKRDKPLEIQEPVESQPGARWKFHHGT